MVRDPEGRTWIIRRLWMAWRPKWRGMGGETDLGVAGGAGPGTSVAEGVLFGLIHVVGATVVHVLIPGLMFVIEMAFYLVVLSFVVGARVLLKLSWTIEANRNSGVGGIRWRISGLRESARAVDELAAAIREGRAPTWSPVR